MYWVLLPILALPLVLCLQGETSLPPPSPAYTYQVQKWQWKKRLGKNAQKYWVILRNTQRSQLGLVDLGSHERQACLDGGGLARAGNRGQSCNGGGTHVLNISIIDQIFSSQNFVLCRVSAVSPLWIAWRRPRCCHPRTLPRHLPRSGCLPETPSIFEQKCAVQNIMDGAEIQQKTWLLLPGDFDTSH